MKAWLASLKGRFTARTALLAALLLTAALLALSPAIKSGADGMTAEEKRLARTLSEIAGAGDVRVTIYYAAAPSAFSSGVRTPSGALVVAQGARDIAVRLDLAAAVQALLSLPPENVRVFAMEGLP